MNAPWILLAAALAPAAAPAGEEPAAPELSLWQRLAGGLSAAWENATQAAHAGAAWLSEPTGRTLAAIVLGAVGIWLMLPGSFGRVWLLAPLARWCGCRTEADGEPQSTGLFGVIAAGLHFFTTLYGVGVLSAVASWLLLVSLLPAADEATLPIVFWILAGLTLAAAVATIVMQSPVYCAVWFGVTLLGTGGLFLIQGAQFLGVATVVVYAGAILVTFLFVLMLAQPEGYAFYDRLSWGPGPTAFAAAAGVTIAAVIVAHVAGVTQVPVVEAAKMQAGVLATQHVAHLGGELFSVHLVAVEVAGALLLAALVGAVAIAIQGKPAERPAEQEAVHA